MLLRYSTTTKLRTFHVANHIALLYGLYFYSYYWVFLSALAWFFIGSLGVSIGYHRLLSHRSFKTHPAYLKCLTILGCLSLGGSPISWVGAHRLHHKFTDSQKDPHSHSHIGKLRAYLHLWDQFVIPRSLVKDLVKDPFIKYVHRNYFLIVGLWAIACYLISIPMGIFLFSAPCVFAFHAYGLINVFGHGHGGKTFTTSDKSSNSWIANLLTFGEGWHNNHHKYPSFYRIGLKKNEYDISAFLLEKLGIMRDIDAQLLKRESILCDIENEY